MDQWVWPAYVGIFGGVVVFAAVFVPALAVQMRRYGRLSLARLLGAAALAVYGVALVAYTMLPMPSGDVVAWCAQYATDGAQLRPFQFVDDIRAGTAGLGWKATMTSTVVLQVVFNVVLFVPLGFFARRFLGRGVIVSTLLGAATSLLIEVTQYTGIYGLVPCSYRVADIDDLLANTAGALIGALIAPLLLGWMPQTRELARTRLTPRPVTTWRRWAGMLIDAAAATALGAVLVISLRFIRFGAGQDVSPGDLELTEWVLQYPVPFLIVFTAPALFGSGASLGQRLVWLRPVTSGGRLPGHGRLLARAWATGGLWLALLAAAAAPDSAEHITVRLDQIAALLGLAAVLAVIGGTHRGLSGMVTGLHVVDARPDPQDDADSDPLPAHPCPRNTGEGLPSPCTGRDL